jgi:hypothetical protein
MKRMKFDFRSFISPPPINGTTLNSVMLDPSFILFMYILICIVMVSLTVLYLNRRSGLFPALSTALITTFFTAGIIYAAHADIGWTMWLTNDIGMFAGKSMEEKMSAMDDTIWDFSREAKAVIPHEYVLFSSDETAALRTEYFLLPLRKREQADYIVVLRDRQADFDPVTGTLSRGDSRIGHVEAIRLFAHDTYILKRKSP